MTEQRPDYLRPFDDKPIQVRTMDGLQYVEARIVGCWGVHPVVRCDGLKSDLFIITHIPPGVALPVVFKTEQQACTAAVEIHRLRNDWPVWTWMDWSSRPEVSKQVREIIAKHGGGAMFNVKSAADETSINNLNGYDDEPISGRG